MRLEMHEEVEYEEYFELCETFFEVCPRSVRNQLSEPASGNGGWRGWVLPIIYVNSRPCLPHPTRAAVNARLFLSSGVRVDSNYHHL